MSWIRHLKFFDVHSVRTKLVLLIIVSVMLPTLCLGWLSYSSAKKALTEDGIIDLTKPWPLKWRYHSSLPCF